jgi:hypothetical protein
VIIDEDGPWTAAAYLADDQQFQGIQHGMADDDRTLCGIPEERIEVVRNPFYGKRSRDCADCAAELRRLAGERPAG